MLPLPYCAIDFGTSNSAIALPTESGVRLVALEADQRTMPTAVFYAVEGLAAHELPQRHYGRAAVAAYVEGIEGRLMRSMKSILGSTLAEQATDVGAGKSVRYLDVVSGYLRHLKALAERDAQVANSRATPGASSEIASANPPTARPGRFVPLTRVILGRPVFFVDDDPQRDARAQDVLAQAARDVGFREVLFQYEPIAAALDYETTINTEQLVLVADIGGGTSDFSLVRVGPQRRAKLDRRGDILANHGVHSAGTDFDRHIELARILPHCGYLGHGPNGREVPSKVYFDLATWHLINTVYVPGRVAELRQMKGFYNDLLMHQRLLTVVTEQLGHALIARAEAAKIEVAEQGLAHLDLSLIEPGLAATLNEAEAVQAMDADLQRIVCAADQTLRQAGLAHDQIDVLYFTGGSTGFTPLTTRIAARFPNAAVRRGDRFASVAQGLGVHARRVFAGALD